MMQFINTFQRQIPSRHYAGRCTHRYYNTYIVMEAQLNDVHISRSIIGIGRHTYCNIVLYCEYHIHRTEWNSHMLIPSEWSSGHYSRRIDDIQHVCLGPFIRTVH